MGYASSPIVNGRGGRHCRVPAEESSANALSRLKLWFVTSGANASSAATVKHAFAISSIRQSGARLRAVSLLSCQRSVLCTSSCQRAPGRKSVPTAFQIFSGHQQLLSERRNLKLPSKRNRNPLSWELLTAHFTRHRTRVSSWGSWAKRLARWPAERVHAASGCQCTTRFSGD